jgi:hypothetical protein
MTSDFAMLSWGRALLLDEWNQDTANTFVQQWSVQEILPERGVC